MKSTGHFGLVYILVCGAVLAAAPAGAFAADLDASEILECQSMQDDSARLACFDELSSPQPEPAPQLEPAPQAAKVPPPAPQTGVSSAPATSSSAPAASASPAVQEEQLNDDIGRESLKGDSGENALMVRGHLVSCEEDLRGKHQFYFDNGQVWKQTSSGEIFWKDCDFDVTIEKDFFGYKMTRDGHKKVVRISRIR